MAIQPIKQPKAPGLAWIWLLTLLSSLGSVKAQDSLSSKRPERPHELGVSVLTPLIMLAGAGEYQERFSNITYRYRFTERHAIRLLAGAAPRFQPESDKVLLSASPTRTLYSEKEITTPSNFQLGLGYEIIWGGRVKPSVGLDLIYNNKFEKETVYYTEDVPSGPQSNIIIRQRLDSSKVVNATNLDKVGANFFFSLRYEINRRWTLSGSTIMQYRYFKPRAGVSESDLNMLGLLGDLSLFVKF